MAILDQKMTEETNEELCDICKDGLHEMCDFNADCPCCVRTIKFNLGII